jgi:hypothetical protein
MATYLIFSSKYTRVLSAPARLSCCLSELCLSHPLQHFSPWLSPQEAVPLHLLFVPPSFYPVIISIVMTNRGEGQLKNKCVWHPSPQAAHLEPLHTWSCGSSLHPLCKQQWELTNSSKNSRGPFLSEKSFPGAIPWCKNSTYTLKRANNGKGWLGSLPSILLGCFAAWQSKRHTKEWKAMRLQ